MVVGEDYCDKCKVEWEKEWNEDKEETKAFCKKVSKDWNMRN